MPTPPPTPTPAPEAEPAPPNTPPDGVTPAEAAAADAVVPVPRWAIHRRMYDWVLGFADSKHSSTALFGISFAESSFFPIPPDVLLAPLCMGKRSKAFWFAAVCTIASVLGALLGYYIGYAAIDLAVRIPGIDQEGIDKLAGAFAENGDLYVFVAALTPIPFKLLTITAGTASMSLLPFVVACLIGRAARFFAVAAIFWWVGPKAAPFIDRYFNWLCIAFTILLVGGIYLLKFAH